MKILVIGADGYIGKPLCKYLENHNHEVRGVDSLIKRGVMAGVSPLIDIPLTCDKGDARNLDLSQYHPDAIIHLGQLPSAPYSMQDYKNCLITYENNVQGNLNLLWQVHRYCPDAHLIHMGTMGEYGTPNIDIEEGWLDVEHNGRKDTVLYPKKPGSFYHLTKVHDSDMLAFACRVWGLRVTDLNQGIVYGTDTGVGDTRFCYDEVWGTALNRFITQAVAGHPLTVYGNGSQTRGWINIRDSLECLRLAVENPANPGEFRVMNQFTEQYSVKELAEKVQRVSQEMRMPVRIENVMNPRVEQEDHYYNAKHTKLPDLGLNPTLLDDDVLAGMLDYVRRHRDNIVVDQILPTVKWA